MKMRSLWLATVVVSSLLGIWACGGQQWRIRDAMGQVQTIQDIRFEPADRVEFRVGSTRKWLEANQIQWMSIDPGSVQTEGVRVFYGVRMLLQDGSRFPDSTSADTVGGVFLPVDGILVGSAQVGRVEVPLSKLLEIGTQEYYAPPEKE